MGVDLFSKVNFLKSIHALQFLRTTFLRYQLGRIGLWLLSSFVCLCRRPKNPVRIILLGLGKTGTSIAAYRIHAGLSLPKWIYFEPFTFSQSETKEINRHLKAQIHPHWNVITKCLIQPQNNPDWDLIKEYSKAYNRHIWISRDPRDRLISDFLYGAYWKQAPPGREKEFERSVRNKLQRVREKELNPQKIPFKDLYFDPEELRKDLQKIYNNLLASATPMLESWFVLRYENFVDGRFQELNQYLGITVDTKAEVPDKLRRVTRTRGHGNWRDWFTPEDVVFFKPIFENYLKRFGYDANDWNLNRNPKLNPEFGSEYIEKLFYSRIF